VQQAILHQCNSATSTNSATNRVITRSTQTSQASGTRKRSFSVGNFTLNSRIISRIRLYITTRKPVRLRRKFATNIDILRRKFTACVEKLRRKYPT